MSQAHFFAIALLTPILQFVTSEEVENSRTYGKMYVAPLQLDQFPPVCVVEHVSGPNVNRDVKTMRDPRLPCILIFCKDLNADAADLFRAFESLAAFGELRCFITVTDSKGVWRGDKPESTPEHYYDSQEARTRIAELHAKAAKIGLDEACVGLAVNRFWQSSIGYTSEADMAVAYVRGRVRLIEHFSASKVTPQQANQLLKKVGGIHRSTVAQLAK